MNKQLILMLLPVPSELELQESTMQPRFPTRVSRLILRPVLPPPIWFGCSRHPSLLNLPASHPAAAPCTPTVHYTPVLAVRACRASFFLTFSRFQPVPSARSINSRAVPAPLTLRIIPPLQPLCYLGISCCPDLSALLHLLHVAAVSHLTF